MKKNWLAISAVSLSLVLIATVFQNCGEVRVAPMEISMPLSAKTELCTMPPSKLNNLHRILFFVDNSQSMSGIDPAVDASGNPDSVNGTTRRIDALRRLIDQYKTDDNFTISFAELKDNTAKFLSSSSAATSSCVFFKPRTDMSAVSDVLNTLDVEGRQASGATAFKSFYDQATTCIQSDKTVNPMATYSVVMVTDGAANDITPQQNYDLVKYLVGLGKSAQEASEFSKVNVFFYFMENFNSNPDANVLMSNIIRKAQLAGGNRSRFLVQDNGGPLDYNQIGILTLVKYRLKRFFVTNVNAALTREGKLTVDSDGDGMPDQEELDRGYDPTKLATGGVAQMCSDLVKIRNGGTCQSSCTQGQQYADYDHDGLNDCDETVYGTDVYSFDTDRDYIYDGLEARISSNPLANDSSDDEDNDGLDTLQEAYQQSHSLIDNRKVRNPEPAHVDVTYVGEQNGQNCYDINISNVPLFMTQAVDETMSGWQHDKGGNVIKLMFLQVPEDDSNGQAILLFSEKIVYYSNNGSSSGLNVETQDFHLYERPSE